MKVIEAFKEGAIEQIKEATKNKEPHIIIEWDDEGARICDITYYIVALKKGFNIRCHAKEDMSGGLILKGRMFNRITERECKNDELRFNQ